MSRHIQQETSRTQQDVIDFLGSSQAYGAASGVVDRIDTHGAIVFLAGEFAFKIKKAVRFAYMDFSTLDLRHRACEREIELNQPHAPDLYLGVVAITRGADGALGIGGKGEAIEWAVHMRRFDGNDLLSAVVERDAFGPILARQTADAIFDYHQASPIAQLEANPGGFDTIIAGVADGLRAGDLAFDRSQVADLTAGMRRHLARISPLIDRRERAGFVRRCHGDLHAANIVLWHGRPTLFDAIEFDEEIATIDMLYDLAFLLMDLDAHGHLAAANTVLNRYLWRSQEMLDIEGLAALPLFLALRAGIRGMVHAQRGTQSPPDANDRTMVLSRLYLDRASSYLRQVNPRLVAVGGLSGTGKSTLAAAVAPRIGPAPGAIHFRSDLERKAMLGVGETERLPAESYTADMSLAVYERLLHKAKVALEAGHSVVVDAVFLAEGERRSLERTAQSLGLPFQGLWLTAPIETLIERVNARAGDASDATADVVRRQVETHREDIEWSPLDASKSPELVQQAACRLLEIV